MAHEALAIVRLVSNTGIPADTVEMQFAFSECSENGGSGGSAIAAINNFLNGSHGTSGGTLSSLLAGSLNHTLLPVCDVYDISAVLGGGLRGSPIASGNLGALDTPSVDTDLPLQASIGLSYHANLTGIPEFGPDASRPSTEAAQDQGAPATHTARTRPKATRRGRIFFGPLNEAAMDSDTLRIREPSVAFLDVGKGAMADLSTATAGWSVWSRSTGALHAVTGGWIAHETDVVRRRRMKATARSLWP